MISKTGPPLFCLPICDEFNLGISYFHSYLIKARRLIKKVS